MENYYSNENLETSSTILTVSPPKKSKALSKNIEKIQRFFYKVKDLVALPENKSVDSLEQIIQRLNESKENILNEKEQKLDKMTKKYIEDVEKSESVVELEALKQKTIQKENEINEVTNSKIAAIDNKIEGYQAIIDGKINGSMSPVNEKIVAEQLKLQEQQRMQEIQNMEPIEVEPIIQPEPIVQTVVNEVSDQSVELTEADKKNLKEIKAFIERKRKMNEAKNQEYLKPMSENNIENTNIGVTQTEVELEPIQQAKKTVEVQNENLVSGLENNKVEDNNINIEFNQNANNNSEINRLNQSYLENMDSIKKRLDENIASVLTSSLGELEKLYRDYYQGQIKLFTDKTASLIEKANAEVNKVNAEKDNIIKERDSIVSSKDQEIASLKEQLMQARTTIEESQKRENSLKEELNNSSIKIERYKGVIDAFANQGITTGVDNYNLENSSKQK